MSDITKILMFIKPYLGYILTTGFIGTWLGIKLSNKYHRNKSLAEDVYCPLYQETKEIIRNVSKFSNCFINNRGNPSQYASASPGKFISNIKLNLEQNGKYFRVPNRFRKKIDEYYEKCDEFNGLLNNVFHMRRKIIIEEISSLNRLNQREPYSSTCFMRLFWAKEELEKAINYMDKDIKIGLMFIQNSDWKHVLFKKDMDKNNTTFKNFLTKIQNRIEKETSIIELRKLQEQLKNPKYVLNKLIKNIKKS